MVLAHLLLGERLDAIPHDVNATIVRCIQLKHRFLVTWTENRPRKTMY